MSVSELPTEPVVGVTIVRRENESQQHEAAKSTHSLQNEKSRPATRQSLPDPCEEFDPHVGAKPYSPFYTHDVNNDSLVCLKSGTTAATRKESCDDLDLETGTTISPQKQSMEVHGICQSSRLWAQKKRKCDCLASLTKRQRLMVKVALALLIVGTMIGIAMGITVAVGGGVWKSANVRGSLGR